MILKQPKRMESAELESGITTLKKEVATLESIVEVKDDIIYKNQLDLYQNAKESLHNEYGDIVILISVLITGLFFVYPSFKSIYFFIFGFMLLTLIFTLPKAIKNYRNQWEKLQELEESIEAKN